MTKTERVTHELRGSNGDVVAQIEEWQGVDGPYLAIRYRGGDWEAAHSAHSGRLEWAMRTMLNRQVEYLCGARQKTAADKEGRRWHKRAVREIAWALASWATQTNWTEVAPVAREVGE